MTAQGSTPPVLWFLDTASLLSMAVDPLVETAVENEIAFTNGKMVLIDVVRDELIYRAGQQQTAVLARKALAHIGSDTKWLTTEWIGLDAIQQVQHDVADGHPLKDDYEHWAESVVVALCRASQARDQARGCALDIRFLTEDFNARRVANREPSITPLSLHRLFHNRVCRGAMSASEAQQMSKLIQAAGRGPDTNADDFLGKPKLLGRPGWP